MSEGKFTRARVVPLDWIEFEWNKQKTMAKIGNICTTEAVSICSNTFMISIWMTDSPPSQFDVLSVDDFLPFFPYFSQVPTFN